MVWLLLPLLGSFLVAPAGASRLQVGLGDIDGLWVPVTCSDELDMTSAVPLFCRNRSPKALSEKWFCAADRSGDGARWGTCVCLGQETARGSERKWQRPASDAAKKLQWAGDPANCHRFAPEAAPPALAPAAPLPRGHADVKKLLAGLGRLQESLRDLSESVARTGKLLGEAYRPALDRKKLQTAVEQSQAVTKAASKIQELGSRLVTSAESDLALESLQDVIAKLQPTVRLASMFSEVQASLINLGTAKLRSSDAPRVQNRFDILEPELMSTVTALDNSVSRAMTMVAVQVMGPIALAYREATVGAGAGGFTRVLRDKAEELKRLSLQLEVRMSLQPIILALDFVFTRTEQQVVTKDLKEVSQLISTELESLMLTPSTALQADLPNGHLGDVVRKSAGSVQEIQSLLVSTEATFFKVQEAAAKLYHLVAGVEDELNGVPSMEPGLLPSLHDSLLSRVQEFATLADQDAAAAGADTTRSALAKAASAAARFMDSTLRERGPPRLKVLLLQNPAALPLVVTLPSWTPTTPLPTLPTTPAEAKVRCGAPRSQVCAAVRQHLQKEKSQGLTSPSGTTCPMMKVGSLGAHLKGCLRCCSQAFWALSSMVSRNDTRTPTSCLDSTPCPPS